MLIIETKAHSNSLQIVQNLIIESKKLDSYTFKAIKYKSLLIVRNPDSEFSIVVRPSFLVTPNLHRHTRTYNKKLQNLWEVDLGLFWDAKAKTKIDSKKNHPAFYVFHSGEHPLNNIVVTRLELISIMHQQIDMYLKEMQLSFILPEHLDYWHLCDLCFGELMGYNDWNKLVL